MNHIKTIKATGFCKKSKYFPPRNKSEDTLIRENAFTFAPMYFFGIMYCLMNNKMFQQKNLAVDHDEKTEFDISKTVGDSLLVPRNEAKSVHRNLKSRQKNQKNGT